MTQFKAINVDPDLYQMIEETIASDSSPVGIDAKHTHVVIIKLLLDINRRLDELEQAVQNSKS